jgi:hypothetical protein
MRSRLTSSFIALAMLLSLASASALKAQWQQILTGDAANKITCVYFNQSGVGFLGVESPTGVPSTVWRSSDSGATWSPAAIDYTHTAFGFPLAEDFAFKDSKTGWFASRRGIYRTDDGGLSWVFAGSSAPLDGARAIWYDSVGHMLLRSSWDSGPLYWSSDDGVIWQRTGNPSSFGVNGFSQVDDSTIVAGNGARSADFLPIVRSRDHGKTWSDLGLHTECWQPYCDRTKGFLLLGFDKEPTVFKSTNGGDSWRGILAFSNDLDQSTGCIRGDAHGNVYAQTIYTTFYRSTDDGETWQDICGPTGNVDTRFTIFGDRLFTADQWGNLWSLDLARVNRVSIDSGLTLTSVSCDPAIRYLHISASFACQTDITIDSVTVAGDAFAVSWTPDGRTANDSVQISYTPSGGRDSAVVVFHLRRNGIAIDTSVVVYGTSVGSASQPAELQLVTLDGSHTGVVSPGMNVSLSLRARNRLPAELMIHAINFHATVTSACSFESVSPMNGWRAQMQPTDGRTLAISLSRDQPVDIEAGEEIARITVRTYLTLDTIADAVLMDYMFNPGDVFLGCSPLVLTPDSVRLDLAGACGDDMIRQFLRTGSPLSIESLSPDPASSLLHIVVPISTVATSYEVCDALGRTVLSGSLQSPDIDLTGLPSGHYYLRVARGSKFASRGFVVQK